MAWPLFGLFRILTDPAAGDALGWTLVYAFLMLRGGVWLSALLGALLGAILAWLQKRQVWGLAPARRGRFRVAGAGRYRRAGGH